MKDYKTELLELLKTEFVEVMNSDYDYYKKYNIVLSNEQQYVKNIDRSPNKIYIVVKFLEATLFYGQIVQPININAIGVHNDIEVCQRLLSDFANKYNLNEDVTIGSTNNVILKQYFNAPQVMNRFEQIYEGFRTLFYLSGSFLIGENSNSISSIEVLDIVDSSGNPYKVQFLTTQWSYDNQLDTQAYTGTNNRTKSYAKICTLSISFTIFLKNDAFCNKLLGMAWNNTTLAPQGNATTFTLKVTFKSGLVINGMVFKLANCSAQQNIGEFPPISITLTN